MPTTQMKRKFLAVTMLPDLYEAAKREAQKRDMAVTTWVREVLKKELGWDEASV